MSNDLMLIFLIALALFLMQSIGGWFQIRDYKKAVQRMRQLGRNDVGGDFPRKPGGTGGRQPSRDGAGRRRDGHSAGFKP